MAVPLAGAAGHGVAKSWAAFESARAELRTPFGWRRPITRGATVPFPSRGLAFGCPGRQRDLGPQAPGATPLAGGADRLTRESRPGRPWLPRSRAAVGGWATHLERVINSATGPLPLPSSPKLWAG